MHGRRRSRLRWKMKTIIIAILSLIIVSVAVAGEIRTTPQDIVLLDPLTDQVELISQTYYYGASPHLVIKYNVLTNDGDFVREHSIVVNGTDFTDFVAGYGSTMVSRGDTTIWGHITSTYDTQPK